MNPGANMVAMRVLSVIAVLAHHTFGFPVATSLNGMSGEQALLDLFKCGARHFGTPKTPWDENCSIDATTGSVIINIPSQQALVCRAVVWACSCVCFQPFATLHPRTSDLLYAWRIWAESCYDSSVLMHSQAQFVHASTCICLRHS